MNPFRNRTKEPKPFRKACITSLAATFSTLRPRRSLLAALVSPLWVRRGR